MIRIHKANPGFDSRPWKVSLFHWAYCFLKHVHVYSVSHFRNIQEVKVHGHYDLQYL